MKSPAARGTSAPPVHARGDVDPEQMAHEILTLAYGTHLLGRPLDGRGAVKRLRTAIERVIADARATRN